MIAPVLQPAGSAAPIGGNDLGVSRSPQAVHSSVSEKEDWVKALVVFGENQNRVYPTPLVHEHLGLDSKLRPMRKSCR